MSDKFEKRKSTFKAKQLNSSERIRKHTEQVRKEKRSVNMLAKRLKSEPGNTAGDIQVLEYSSETAELAIANIKVICST